MSVSSEITRISGAKADIKTAIETKGIIVPSSTLIDGYASLASQIQSANGSLPAGYTWVAYIGGQPNAWVNTGVDGSPDLDIRVRFMMGKWVQYASLYANYVNEQSHANRLIMASSDTTNMLVGDGGTNFAFSASGFNRFPLVNDVRVTEGNVVVNGTSQTITASSKTANSTEIALFASKTSGTTTQIYFGVCEFEIKNNGTSLIHYIPCLRDSDGKPGFYDITNNTFVTSSGNADLVACPGPSQQIIFNQNS